MTFVPENPEAESGGAPTASPAPTRSASGLAATGATRTQPLLLAATGATAAGVGTLFLGTRRRRKRTLNPCGRHRRRMGVPTWIRPTSELPLHG